jgi:2-amino-4-hydroxy-6-hydroxymethyldihydropteridine diphosphokinase
MTRAVLSLGSNLGDSVDVLRAAVDGLGSRLQQCSDVYATAPWGVTDQPEFRNLTAIAADDGLGPYGWLELARGLEARAGRVRTRRWGPRTLDVDVITVDERRWQDPELTLPHPRAHERAFVLLPWAQIEPDAVLPGRGPVAALLRALPAEELSGVRRLGRLQCL